MKYEIVELKEKIVAGVSARTSNAAPDMQQVIGGLWKSFYEDGIYAKLPNKVSEKAIGMYSDYEEGVMGNYDATVCCEVSGTDGLPEGVTVKTVPAGRYAKFVVVGDMVEAVGQFWQEVWNMPLDRSFACDFEEYQDDCMENATIHMYLSLK